jgi:8-oxo-dGTP diphosphatase
MKDRRYSPYPIPAAGIILLQEGKTEPEVLLIRRGHPPAEGQWTFPGGAPLLGETIRECARREAKEELGLELEILEVVEVVDRIFHDTQGRIEYHYLIVDFLAKVKGGAMKPGEEVLEVKWVPVSFACREVLSPSTGEILKKALQLWEHNRKGSG